MVPNLKNNFLNICNLLSKSLTHLIRILSLILYIFCSFLNRDVGVLISVLSKFSRYFIPIYSLLTLLFCNIFFRVVLLKAEWFLFFFFLQEKIAAAHLKHSYDNLCNSNVEQSDCKSYTSKINDLFSWIFSGKNKEKVSQKIEL